MRKHIVSLLISLLLIFSSMAAYGYTADYYEKFYYTGQFYGSWYLYSPFRDGSNNKFYPGITSKYNNPRSLSSSPHGGVDFTASTGTNVYPLAPGVVEYVNTSIDPSFGKYVVVRYDVNQDGYNDSVFGRHAI
ncbi:MAG: M23 family metallopeptidase [Bacillota bacterium]